MSDLKNSLNAMLDWIEAQGLEEAYNIYALAPENAGKPIPILVKGFCMLHNYGAGTE